MPPTRRPCLEEGLCSSTLQPSPTARISVSYKSSLTQQFQGLSPFFQLVAAVVLIHVFLAAAIAAPTLLHLGKNLFRAVYYNVDPMLLGRNEARFPAPTCPLPGTPGGFDQASLNARPLVLTYIRSDNYLPLLQQFECTFRRSNPGVELGVMTVPGELGPDTLAWLDSRDVTRIEVPPLNYPNYYNPRYGQNWLKLRAWSMTEYSSILLIDSDTVVLGSLSPLFSLPVGFAASWDQSKLLGRFNTQLSGINGGVLLLRPCPEVQQHMVSLLDNHPKLRFSHGAAEQDFLNWYFRYTGMMLPLEYNAMASDSLKGNLTIGGKAPVVVHFTQNKPFHGSVAGKPGHQFLCPASELER